MSYESPRCEYCGDSGLISVVHKDSDGKTNPILQEYADRHGEVKYYRWPARMAVHCTECPKGNWMRQTVHEEERERIPTLQHVFEQRRNGRPFPYVLEQSVPEYFNTREEGLRYLANIKNVAKTFPAVPKAPPKTTAVEVANALYERTKRIEQEQAEKVEEPAGGPA